MRSLIELSANATRQKIQAGEVSRVEVVRAHLDHAHGANDRVGAITQFREEAVLAEAEAADRTGENHAEKLLDGVPVTVKEQFDVAGLATTEGSSALTERLAAQDSTMVHRLKEHGALIIGKGNQPDFAMRWNTNSSQLGWTRNPHDLHMSVGGSSGGDAAAVTAGISKLGFGTDLAGSIRVPAAFCHIYGLRATPGRIPFTSEHDPHDRSPAMEAMSSQGHFARTVEDLWTALKATAGSTYRHPFSIPGQSSLNQAGGPVKVARIIDQSGTVVSPEMRERMNQVTELLTDAGYVVKDVPFPGACRAPDLWGEILCTELRLIALPRLADAMEPSCLDHIEKLSSLWETSTGTEQLLARWAERAALLRQLLEWMETYPLILSPIAGMPLPLPLEYDQWASTEELAGITNQMRNSLWPAMFGLPAVAVPQGCQIVARPHQDEDALAAAAVIEQSTKVTIPEKPHQN